MTKEPSFRRPPIANGRSAVRQRARGHFALSLDGLPFAGVRVASYLAGAAGGVAAFAGGAAFFAGAGVPLLVAVPAGAAFLAGAAGVVGAGKITAADLMTSSFGKFFSRYAFPCAV